MMLSFLYLRNTVSLDSVILSVLRRVRTVTHPVSAGLRRVILLVCLYTTCCSSQLENQGEVGHYSCRVSILQGHLADIACAGGINIIFSAGPVSLLSFIRPAGWFSNLWLMHMPLLTKSLWNGYGEVKTPSLWTCIMVLPTLYCRKMLTL